MGASLISEALGVTSTTAARLDAVAVRRRLPARSYLFLEGDASTSVLVVEVGMLRIDRTTRSGRRVLFDLATPGDLCGELGVVDKSPRSATASTVVASRVLSIGADEFREVLAHEPDLAGAVLGRAVRRLRELSDQLVEAGARSARSRVAARLVKLNELDGGRSEAPFDLALPITQEELGQWAGLSREGVVKGLAELRGAGLIETGRRRVTVLDVAGLRHEAAAANG